MAEMPIYLGHRTSRGVEVRVDDLRGNIIPLPHVEYHSPDGFEWGYGGSGPADLALSILAHFFERLFGKVEKRHINFSPHPAVALHQDFKWHFVSKFPPSWSLNGSKIDAWLNSDEIRPAFFKEVERFREYETAKEADL